MLESIETIRELVLRDAALQARLRGAPDLQAFAQRLVEVAAENGLHLTAAEVEDAVIEARHEWRTRWI